MLLQVALHGRRSPLEHAALPVTPEHLAREAGHAVAAGAGAIHAHVRAANGQESLTSDDVMRAVTALRTILSHDLLTTGGHFVVAERYAWCLKAHRAALR